MYKRQEKYGRDIRHFLAFAGKKEVTKELLLQYKDSLLRQNYAVASINSMVVALNRYFEYLGRGELRIKLLKYQRQVYCPEEKEISREEYSRLVKEARRRKDDRLSLILQTIASTGIRIGELKDITVTAVSYTHLDVYKRQGGHSGTSDYGGVQPYSAGSFYFPR